MTVNEAVTVTGSVTGSVIVSVSTTVTGSEAVINLVTPALLRIRDIGSYNYKEGMNFTL